MTRSIAVDGRTLTLEAIEAVARDPSVRVTLDDTARERVKASRDFIEAKVATGEPVYGVTTGFGRLADISIPADQRATLQHNLVRSHASGMGDPMSQPSVRALMVLRANALEIGRAHV